MFWLMKVLRALLPVMVIGISACSTNKLAEALQNPEG